MAKVKDYMSLVVFNHTIFAMPFAMAGFFLAIRYSGYPLNIQILVLCIFCMITARNAAMGFNRWADRKIDILNPRTSGREIPSGKISENSALVFTVINAILFIVSTGFINNLCLMLSPIALLIVLGYSYTKRFTWLCHFILGIGLSLAPIGAYIAITAHFHWLPLLFSAIVITWVGGFDIIYALQDTRFDQRHGYFSIPSQVGNHSALTISAILHVLTFLIVLAAGILAGFGLFYWIGALLFSILLFYQHRIVTAEDISRVNRAFGTTNGIASVIYATFLIIDLYIK